MATELSMPSSSLGLDPPDPDPTPAKKKGKYASKQDKLEADVKIYPCVNIKLCSIWSPALKSIGPTFQAFRTVLEKLY